MVPQIRLGCLMFQSRRSFSLVVKLCAENQPLEMKLESTPDFSHAEMRASSRPFNCLRDMRFGPICSLAFLSSSSVVRVSSPPQFGRRKWRHCVLRLSAAGTRNHRARSTPFSFRFSTHPPGCFFRG